MITENVKKNHYELKLESQELRTHYDQTDVLPDDLLQNEIDFLLYYLDCFNKEPIHKVHLKS